MVATRVGIYCRVSSAEQERRGTIEAQRTALLAHAERAGLTVVGVYCDDGRSAATGKLDERAAYARLLVAVERREVDAVLVVAIDRLTRTDDLIERAAILGPLQRAGVALLTPNGTIDLRTFTGDLMAGLEAAMAALERRKILERTQAGKARVVAAGGKPHGRTPYGLRYDRHAGWSVDAGEVAVVREIHERVAAGESCVRIALDLAARNVPPPGRKWGHTSVWSLVRQARDRYAGRWAANARTGQTVAVPRVLTDEQIDRAEAALVDLRRRGLAHRTRGIYLLDHHAARCGRCGGWIGVRGHGDGRTGYTCRARAVIPVGHPARCDLPIRDTARLDAWLWDALIDILTTPERVERALRQIRDRGTARDPVAARRAVAEARERLAELDRRAEVLAGRVDALPAPVLAQALDRLAQERQAAQGALVAAQAAAEGGRLAEAATEDLDATIEALRVRAASASVAERRAITRELVACARLDDRRLVAEVKLPIVARDPDFGSSWWGGSQAPAVAPLGRLRVLAA